MRNLIQTNPQIGAPSWALLGLEPVRAALEYAGMRLMDKSNLPQGDGHHIVLFPGLASDQRVIGPLTRFCEELGYTAHDWGRGFNTGPQGNPDAWLDLLSEHVLALTDPGHQSISLIGWSLGGIYAREVAKRLYGRVRQVISIGAPFAASARQTNAGLLYRLVNGSDPTLNLMMRKSLCSAPRVPTTSIYSRSDGVVPWQACQQVGSRRNIQNIEVAGSHCGLVCNTEVFEIVADRLAQPQGAWRRYIAEAQRTAGRLR